VGELKQACEAAPAGRLGAIRAGLDAARAGWGEFGGVVLAGGVDYVDGEPVEVRVRKRSRRYTIDDDGAAVARAGSPTGWLEVAERVVEEHWVNVNRRGVVFLPAVEGGADLASLALQIADTSAVVHAALLELDDV